MNKAKLGDTVVAHVTENLKPLTREQMDQQLREALAAWSVGRLPSWMGEKKEYVTLTTQEMVDAYNKGEV